MQDRDYVSTVDLVDTHVTGCAVLHYNMKANSGTELAKSKPDAARCQVLDKRGVQCSKELKESSGMAGAGRLREGDKGEKGNRVQTIPPSSACKHAWGSKKKFVTSSLVGAGATQGRQT